MQMYIIYNAYYMSQSVIWLAISGAGLLIFTEPEASENTA